MAESKFPHIPNPKDYERTIDEGGDEEFAKSNFPHISNPKDYESTADEGEGEDEQFSVNRDSKFPLSHNPNDYESTTNTREDEEFPLNINPKFHLFLIQRIMKPPLMNGRIMNCMQMIIEYE